MYGLENHFLFLGMNWKILACFFSLGLILTESIQAQTNIGIRGGFSSSTLTYRAEVGRRADRVTGIGAPTFAFVIEQYLAKNAGASLEFQYIKLGYTQRDTLERVNQTALEYLKIPFLSNFYFGNRGKFHVKLGPHFGFLMNATDIKREYEGNGLLPTYGGTADTPRNFMYGLTAGVGLSNLFGKNTVAADLRFSYEFGRPENQNRVFDMNSTNLEFTLSYLFQIIKPKWQK